VRSTEIERHFSHKRPAGTLADLLQQVGVAWVTVGENLALLDAQTAIGAAQKAHAGLMASPGHRANVLTPTFQWLGVGTRQRGTRWYFVQIFAR